MKNDYYFVCVGFRFDRNKRYVHVYDYPFRRYKNEIERVFKTNRRNCVFLYKMSSENNTKLYKITSLYKRWDMWFLPLYTTSIRVGDNDAIEMFLKNRKESYYT